MKITFTNILSAIMIAFISFTQVNKSSAQTKVVLAGTFQSELGCTSDVVNGDWEPNCNYTALTYNSYTGMWAGSFNVTAGCHQYKVTYDGSWSINFGENGLQGGANIPLYVPITGIVTFTYNPYTHLVTSSPHPSGFSSNCLPQVVITGSFQSEVGCGSDWDASCSNTALTYNVNAGFFEGDIMIPPGCYEYRVVLNNDWVNNFGRYGTPSDPNYQLSVPGKTSKVHFTYDPISHIAKSGYNFDICLPDLVVLAGSFQNEVGCPGDWQPDCSNTALTFNPETGLYEGNLNLPPGNYEFRTVLNNNWSTNYGSWGNPWDPNYNISIAGKAANVYFTYNPYFRLVNFTIQPETVVIAGSFQHELRCTGDWEPDCDYTRLEYDPTTGTWVDTFLIPEGNWYYKITIDNSWAENYGLGGIRGGDNIPLEVCFPSKIVFKYKHDSHIAYEEKITIGICVYKFYDANVNMYNDENMPMEGVKFTLSGNGINRTATTGSNGKVSFYDIPVGWYSVKETVPSGYIPTTVDSQMVYLNWFSELYFGNVCLGPGGAQGLGYWMNKHGEAKFNESGRQEEILWWLRYLSLRNANGSDFDPYTYAQLKAWMQGANAKNMAYMLSAHMAAMVLNLETSMVNYSSIIYTPGCGNTGVDSNFIYVYSLVWQAHYELMNNPIVPGQNSLRSYFECMKNAFENANNNLSFVQSQSCSSITKAFPDSKPLMEQSIPPPAPTIIRISPNPSSNDFILHFTNAKSNETAQLKVTDMMGRLIYKATGSIHNDFRFGKDFIPGIYLVEIIMDNNKSIHKIVKQ